MVLRNKMSNSAPLKLLLLGGTGALGAAIGEKFKAEGYEVTFGVRTLTNPADQFLLPITEGPVPDLLKGQLFDAVIFAQGANVSFVSETTKALILHNLIKTKGKIVILSSFWELITRQEKFSYTVTKAAVGGLVRSMAVDLGNSKGILVNGLLPGIVDSPMARGLLKPEQIANVEKQTPGKKMIIPSDVANAAFLLGSEDNTAISGQSLVVDFGFSIARII
jgi:NAD(P)-dependent dehydrogenase (short-subunit alcohol dehydrogenase family)